MQWPDSWAAATGWMGGAFLFGILLHSLWPYWDVPDSFWIILLIGLAITFIASKIKGGINRKQLMAAVLIALGLGLWRFDMVRTELPSGLRPFDPNGFARRVEYSDPLSAWRSQITLNIQRALPGDRGALLSGMLYGERGLSREANQRFRDAGMLHLIAVSGSNVTLLVIIVMRLLLGMGLRRRHAFIAFSGLLILFVLFVQPQAPVVRAAIMGWLVEFAPILGRIPRTSRLLLAAAVLFTAWQPWALVFDVSFALSFLATAGLMTWGTWLNQVLEPRLAWKTLREILAATFGATLMTMPYSAWAFGQVSLAGLLTNILAVPLVPWIMATGLTVLIFPSISFLHLPVKGFLDGVLLASELPTRFALGVWRDLSTSWIFMLGCYALAATFWMYLRPKKQLIHIENQEKSRFLSV